MRKGVEYKNIPYDFTKGYSEWVQDKNANQPAEIDVVDSWLNEFEDLFVKSFEWKLELLNQITFAHLKKDILIDLKCNIDVSKILHKINNLTEDELELL